MYETPPDNIYDGCSDQPEAAPKPRQRFQPISAFEFSTLESTGWRIKSILPLGELVVIFGPSGCGKTFFTLAMMMSIARGEPWFGNKTKLGRVVYIAAESAGGFRKRLYAYADHHKLDLSKVQFDIIPDCPNLLHTADAETISKMIGKAAVVVIDTFSRVIPGGNENDGKDVGHAIQQCQLISQKTGALVTLVHHTGHSTTERARGWSGLKAAVDTEISVEKSGEYHVATVTKQKDGEGEQRMGFELKQIHLGFDEDDDPITSCILIPLEKTPEKPKYTKRGKWQRHVMAAFKEYGFSSVPTENLIQSSMQKEIPDPEKEDRRRDLAFQALNALIEQKELTRDGNFISKS